MFSVTSLITRSFCLSFFLASLTVMEGWQRWQALDDLLPHLRHKRHWQSRHRNRWTYKHVCPYTCVSTYPCIWLSLCPFVSPPDCLFIHLSLSIIIVNLSPPASLICLALSLHLWVCSYSFFPLVHINTCIHDSQSKDYHATTQLLSSPTSSSVTWPKHESSILPQWLTFVDNTPYSPPVPCVAVAIAPPTDISATDPKLAQIETHACHDVWLPVIAQLTCSVPVRVGVRVRSVPLLKCQIPPWQSLVWHQPVHSRYSLDH